MAAITYLPEHRFSRTSLAGTVWARRRSAIDINRSIEVRGPRAVPVPGIARDISVKMAATADEWEQALRLTADSYRARGYEPGAGGEFRFTPYHVLPQTVVLVAKERDRVVATLSLVMDNSLLGLPMAAIYGLEVRALRRAGRRLGEVSNFAESGLGLSDFLAVLVSLIKLAWNHHVHHGGDTALISCTPRHGVFYEKVLGFVSLGPARPYPWVQNAIAGGYMLDVPLMQQRVPEIYQKVFEQPLPPDVVQAPRMPVALIRRLARRSDHANPRVAEEILRYVQEWGSPRLW